MFFLNQHNDAFCEISQSLLKTFELSLNLLLPEEQVDIMCDASEHFGGYVIIVNIFRKEERRETNKVAPKAFGSKLFITGQMSLTL